MFFAPLQAQFRLTRGWGRPCHARPPQTEDDGEDIAALLQQASKSKGSLQERLQATQQECASLRLKINHLQAVTTKEADANERRRFEVRAPHRFERPSL